MLGGGQDDFARRSAVTTGLAVGLRHTCLVYLQTTFHLAARARATECMRVCPCMYAIMFVLVWVWGCVCEWVSGCVVRWVCGGVGG